MGDGLAACGGSPIADSSPVDGVHAAGHDDRLRRAGGVRQDDNLRATSGLRDLASAIVRETARTDRHRRPRVIGDSVARCDGVDPRAGAMRAISFFSDRRARWIADFAAA
jgi:hypothetical protein